MLLVCTINLPSRHGLRVRRLFDFALLFALLVIWACDSKTGSQVDDPTEQAGSQVGGDNLIAGEQSGGAVNGGDQSAGEMLAGEAILAGEQMGGENSGGEQSGGEQSGGEHSGGEMGGDEVSENGCQAMRTLQNSCAQGGCHLPHHPRTTLVLTAEAIRNGSLQGYITPNNPDESYLLTRMRDTSAGPLMPLGVATPIEALTELEEWVSRGASTECSEVLPPPLHDPNHQDETQLFTCDEQSPAGTISRLRRVERREWTRSTLKPLNGTWWGSTAKDNPLAAPERLAYSTYAEDVSIDQATLDLYMLVLPEAPANWNTRDPRQGSDDFLPGERTAAVYQNPELTCIFNDAEPDLECVTRYIETFTRHGVFFRAPTTEERDRLVNLLNEQLALESDQSERRATLQFVGETAFMMVGALFRSELGAPVEGDPSRRRLTPDEMALAVGRIFSAHPVGAAVPVSVAALPEADPDSQTPELGRLGQIREAADAGHLYEAETIAEIFELYQGGVDADRYDLRAELDDRRRSRRGEYWLAEQITQFFREWLEYDGVNDRFKDTPGATGYWDGEHGGNPMWDPTTLGFRNLQSGRYGYESTLRDQLDDTIARVVIESHEAGQDVLTALMTTRLWRLPSNLADTNGVACVENEDCVEQGFTRCTALGVCGSSIVNNTLWTTRVYSPGSDVPATPAGRWVELPADERRGVLTHPAWLAAHGGNFEDDASAVSRGRWIRERLFCQTVPGLELVQVEAKLIPPSPDLSARERLRRSVEDPESNPDAATCMGCHRLMNSLGYPFEEFNHAGFRRAFDHGPEGEELAPSGYSLLTDKPDPSWPDEVNGALELSELIVSSSRARRCFVRQTFRYFAGRDEQASDGCVLSAMEERLNETGSLFEMLQALVNSRAFQDRRLPQGEMP